MPDNLDNIIDATVQNQIREQNLWMTPDSGIGILPLLTRAGDLLPPYWSRLRDLELSRFALKVDHVSSAFSLFVSKFASINLKVIPRDPSVKSHIKQADDLTANINEMSNWGKGWAASLAPQMVWSYNTQDNGTTTEIIGDGPPDKARQGFYGLAFLDPSKVQRTSNPTWPIIYYDIGPGGTGNRYKMHYTRVMTATSMPSTYARLNGIGFCALSRMVNTAQHLLDLATTEQEELGSRPKRRLIIGRMGITAQEIANAFMLADRQMDNEGLSRYSKSVVIASSTKPTNNNSIELDVKDLAPALKGEDKERSITLGMFLIALALNIPPRWLWPATSTGATKADAMYQHVAGMGGGIGHLLQVFVNMLGGTPMATVLGKPVPSHLEVVFDNQDDEQDRGQAEIRELRSKVWINNLGDGIIDIRTARLQAYNAGDLTEQEFDDLELEDGRLPDGTDVLNLFVSSDPDMQSLLSISVGDVLNPAANDAELVLPAIEDKILETRAMLQSPTRPAIFDKARQAYAALLALKKLYEGNEPPPVVEQPAEPALPPVPPEPPPAPPEPVVVKENKPGLFDAVLLSLLSRKEKPPIINVTTPDMPEQVFNLTMPEQVFNLTLPEQRAGDIKAIINIPEQPAPKVEVTNHQPAPVVNVKSPEINFPPTKEISPPVVNVYPNIQVPETTVTVTPEIVINVPEVSEEITEVERDSGGFIKSARKHKVYKK